MCVRGRREEGEDGGGEYFQYEMKRINLSKLMRSSEAQAGRQKALRKAARGILHPNCSNQIAF